MKAEYLNPFIEATNRVFQTMLNLEPEKKELKMEEDLITSNDANVVLGVTGDLQGTVIFGFPEEMTLKMVKEMSGMEMAEINSFVSSALGEVANIISGNAMTILHDENLSCDIVPPRIFIGEYKSFAVEEEQPLVLTLSTAMGEFDLNLFLKEKE
ncbi:chemotaxis protein CheX [Isachenkonia alkalipeptolytica]|uniref:Chemotaxis protein CheX n=1 Tax=Isachenkonia alkalipeptolytica TaxID=2565777 RepID=A0AA43XKC3_9CLOT|nr:chemotaxis protein CheX [Isachenkonia alkalipeptolytica]NBG87904.1 chemotaxis protein CheX [Isachenkonia alkalipeptolytica]